MRGLVDVETDAGRVSGQAGQQVDGPRGRSAELSGAVQLRTARRLCTLVTGAHDSRRGATSAQYLPADVRVYGSTFDQYGIWSYAAPTAMSGIRASPRRGVLITTAAGASGVGFGWTFVGYDPWGWATHHYGRWGLSAAGAWFWIPSAGWGAAWVNWAVAPGYVGWCPLGWNNRPVLGFWGHPTVRTTRHHVTTTTRGARGRSSRPNRSAAGRPSIASHSIRGVLRRARAGVCPAADAAVGRDSARLVVAPGSRVAGPSVAPRRPVASRRAAVEPRAMSRAPAGALRRAGRHPRRHARPAAVIYHRGTPSVRARRRPGPARIDRAGVGRAATACRPSARRAVPRGLPAEPMPAAAIRKPDDRRSPYGGSTLAVLARAVVPANDPGRPVASVRDHPDYAVPRGGDAAARQSAHRRHRRAARAANRRGPRPRRGRGSQGDAPRATPRRHRRPAATGRPRARSGAPAGPRSGSERGSSSGTAVPRRR